MSTILFTWNPNKWKWEYLKQAIDEVKENSYTEEPWSCSRSKKIIMGDRAFLMKLGAIQQKGLIGSGLVVSNPKIGEHWDSEQRKKGKEGIYVDILWDVLSDDPIIDEYILKNEPLSAFNWFPQASGIRIPDEIASKLERIWLQKTGKHFEFPLDIKEINFLQEGKKNQRFVKQYERNQIAREDCIAHYGNSCFICGFNFQKQYGDIGKDFIFVHHIIPLSRIGKEHKVDPIKDLRPVCANCHAMLHIRSPFPYSIEELKDKMQNIRKGGRTP